MHMFHSSIVRGRSTSWQSGCSEPENVSVCLERDGVQSLCVEKNFLSFSLKVALDIPNVPFLLETFSPQVCKLIMLSSDTTFKNALSTRHFGLHISVTWKTLVEFQFQFNLLPFPVGSCQHPIFEHRNSTFAKSREQLQTCISTWNHPLRTMTSSRVTRDLGNEVVIALPWKSYHPFPKQPVAKPHSFPPHCAQYLWLRKSETRFQNNVAMNGEGFALILREKDSMLFGPTVLKVTFLFKSASTMFSTSKWKHVLKYILKLVTT